MINTTNLEQAKKLIKSSNLPIIIQAQSLEFNRKILDYGKFTTLLALDKPMNHILAKIATKNNISIGLDLAHFRLLNKKQKAVIISQVIINLKLLRKAKTKISLINSKDSKPLLISLGASTQQTKHF
jgi:RNase P/RNase MRP subunit p30